MDQFNSFMSGSALNTLVGTGDRSTLMMVLQAQSAILAGGGDFTPTPSPLVAAPVQTAEEQASSLATAKGQVSGSCSGYCTLKMMWYGCTIGYHSERTRFNSTSRPGWISSLLSLASCLQDFESSAQWSDYINSNKAEGCIHITDELNLVGN